MLAESARVLLRRWILVIIALVIALWAGGAAVVLVKPGQTTSAEMLFLPSTSQTGVATTTNPFLSIGDSTTVMSFVVQTIVTDDKAVVKLRQRGFTAKFTIGPNPAPNSGPTLLIKADDKSAANAQRTLNAVLDEMQQQLRTVQLAQGVPEKLLINSLVLTSTPQPLPIHKSQVQLAVIAFVAVLFLLLILILLFDRRRAKRKRGRRAKRTSPDAASAAQEDAPTDLDDSEHELAPVNAENNTEEYSDASYFVTSTRSD